MNVAEVIRCMPSDPGFEQFKKVPVNIYPPGSLRLQMPDGINPHFLHTCLVVVKEDMAVARLAIYFNPHIQHQAENTMLFGNFECIDDLAVCGLLMQNANEIVSSEDGKYIIGPMNGSTWDEYRVALTPVKNPFFTDLLSHDWYFRLLTASSFNILEKYYSDISDVRKGLSVDVGHKAYLQDEGITIRTIDMDRFEEELSAVYMLSSTAFAENVFFSPISRTDFINKYTAVKPYLDADFVFLAEKEGTLVAFLLCYPDMFCKTEKRLIVKTMAKDSECKTRGIIDMMIQMMQVGAAEKGYSKLIHAFIHQQNKSRQISGRYDGVLFREYALMIKAVNQ